jgi:hypothetical protein
MEKEIHYEFVNSQTGYVIGHLSLPAAMNTKERIEMVEKKKAELAISNKLFLEIIYWQDHDHPIG